MSEDTSALDRRNFCLSLSIVEGQQIAHASGFSVPSEDVQQHEVLEIISKWMLLSSNGSLEQILTCTEWFVDITSTFNDMEESQKEAMTMAVSSFGVALIINMLDNDYIEFLHKKDHITLDALEILKKFNGGA